MLESAFTSVFRVVTRVPIFPGDKFPNVAKMDRVRCPVLVMHERGDPVIPFHHGAALFAAVHGPKLRLWVDEAGHADVAIVAGDDYDRVLRELLRLVSEQRAARSDLTRKRPEERVLRDGRAEVARVVTRRRGTTDRPA